MLGNAVGVFAKVKCNDVLAKCFRKRGVEKTLWGGLVVEFGVELSWGVRRWTKGNFPAILRSSRCHFPVGRKFLVVEKPIEFGGDIGTAKFN